MFQRITKPDYLGAAASTLCLLHCLATPIVFIASACSATCCADTPVWWQLIDYAFLAVSFIAITVAAKNSTKNWMGKALFASWTLLLLAVMNESFDIYEFPEMFVYLPAFSMIGLHLYNQRYCQCKGESCCTN